MKWEVMQSADKSNRLPWVD